eukprot:755604-Hanusia_phi.AAC.1
MQPTDLENFSSLRGFSPTPVQIRVSCAIQHVGGVEKARGRDRISSSPTHQMSMASVAHLYHLVTTYAVIVDGFVSFQSFQLDERTTPLYLFQPRQAKVANFQVTIAIHCDSFTSASNYAASKLIITKKISGFEIAMQDSEQDVKKLEGRENPGYCLALWRYFKPRQTWYRKYCTAVMERRRMEISPQTTTDLRFTLDKSVSSSSVMMYTSSCLPAAEHHWGAGLSFSAPTISVQGHVEILDRENVLVIKGAKKPEGDYVKTILRDRGGLSNLISRRTRFASTRSSNAFLTC